MGNAKTNKRARSRRNGRLRMFARLFAAQSGLCPYCRDPLDPETMTIDHVVPKYRGGTDDESNLCLACKRCNEDKGSKPLTMYLGQPVPLTWKLDGP